MRILLTLKHLGLPYIHVPVSYPAIAPLLESLRVPPTTTTPVYTLPAVTFPASEDSKAYTVMGALDIAQELCNSTFCNAKMLFPQGDLSIAAAVEFEAEIFPQIMLEGWMEHVLPFTSLILDARGAKYIDESKKSQFGSMHEFRTRVLKQEEETGALKEAIKRAERVEEVSQERKGVFYGGGEEPQYVDFCVVAAVMWGVMVRGDVVLEIVDKIGDGRIGKIVKKCQELLM
ncbi:hypothetical protein E4T39_08566 [Aureobasidium subglaciale]|nr:hypothetical protein E4T39_08566 [Aureobasidium subglaciale]